MLLPETGGKINLTSGRIWEEPKREDAASLNWHGDQGLPEVGESLGSHTAARWWTENSRLKPERNEHLGPDENGKRGRAVTTDA